MNEDLRIIISGGGTGGHIFPAVSIANAIKAKHPNAKILFVGAEGRMEMQRVPAAGYEIKGLPIKGFDRAHKLKKLQSIVQTLEKSTYGTSDYQRFQTPGCCRCWRICKWSNSL